MGNFEKAVDFYLRGFNGKYIKRRTGISMQSLLKQLLSDGIKYTKDDIAEHQVEYIRNKYTISEIEDAYVVMSETFDDPYKASRGRNIEMLGCGFGQYARVLKELLGDEGYLKLRNTRWKKNQEATMQSKYGVTNVFEKATFDQFVTQEAVAEGRLKRTNTLIERYGVEHPNQNPEILAKMQKQLAATNMERYGVPNAMQFPAFAAKSSANRQMSMLNKYGFGNSVEIKDIRDRIFMSRRDNNTLNTSRPEDALGDLLRDRFGENDVIRNVVVDDRYPYHVDFYIKSMDLFIEMNGDRCHYTHWFDETNLDDLANLKKWTDGMIRIEEESGRNSRYRQFIKTWTISDVAKRNSAKKNKLNYLVLWDGSCHMRDGKPTPTLRDAHAWFDAGCPMPQNWLPENTY